MSKKKPTRDKLEELARAIRDKVSVPRQDEVFRAAIAAAQLASSTDGKVDDNEKKAMVDALEILSGGLVVEWEVEAVLEAAGAAAAQGDDGKAKAIGEKLKALGQPEAGVLVAAFVANATAGIDQKEAKVLRAIAKAAGVADKRIREILKEVGAEQPAE